MWRWAKDNWHKIDEAFHSDLLRILVPIILGGLSTEDQMTDVISFFDGRDTSLYSHILKQELEKISTRQKWAERDDSDLTQWLCSQGYLDEASCIKLLDGSTGGKATAGIGMKDLGKGQRRDEIAIYPKLVTVGRECRSME